MKIVIFGAGSLGSLLGALLDRAHEVLLVGRDPHASAIRDDGLRVTGIETFAATPDATTDGTGLDADVAIVTVKAYDTETAARTLATGDIGTAVSLQNGLGNEETLAAHLDCPVVAGTTTYGAMRTDPGVVEWTGQGDVVLGNWRTDGDDAAARVADAFRAASVDVAVDPAIRQRLWTKLAVNAAINPLTALARIPNGAVFTGPTADYAAAAARETARVARAHGIELADETAVDRARTVARRTADNRSSMYRDVLAGRRTEIDSISGVVTERAAEYGVDAPVNGLACALVRGWEAANDLR